MKLKYRPFDLQFAHTWAVSSTLARGGKNFFGAVFTELEDDDGMRGYGETAPSTRYDESPETVLRFLALLDSSRLTFDDVTASMAYLDEVAPGNFAAKAAINVALLDAAAKKAGQPLYDFLQLGFTEGKHLTSFSIGIDEREMIEKKVRAAATYPVLKIKTGGPNGVASLQVVREIFPQKRVRADANEAWLTKEQALREIEALAGFGNIEFIEQPMPAGAPAEAWKWLRARSPIPLFADESYRDAEDLARCIDCFDGVNVKLVKTGGITGALAALTAAREAGLKAMLGCMAESSLLISAAAHLAELTDYLDLDGNLLITNDPYRGVTTEKGILSFAHADEATGLRVRPA